MRAKSFTEHIDEVRFRLIFILLTILIFFFLVFAFGEQFTNFLLAPLHKTLKNVPDMPQGRIIYIGLMDKILSQFQLSLWGAVLLSSPVCFYQIWHFVKPGLYQNERKFIRIFIISGLMLFIFGACFGYYIVLPLLIKTFISFGVTDIEANINLKDYIILASKLLVLCGTIFQIPSIIALLDLLKIVNYRTVKKYKHYVYAGLCVLSGLFTPPDIISLLALWVPLILLFETGLLACRLFIKKA